MTRWTWLTILISTRPMSFYETFSQLLSIENGYVLNMLFFIVEFSLWHWYLLQVSLILHDVYITIHIWLQCHCQHLFWQWWKNGFHIKKILSNNGITDINTNMFQNVCIFTWRQWIKYWNFVFHKMLWMTSIPDHPKPSRIMH